MNQENETKICREQVINKRMNLGVPHKFGTGDCIRYIPSYEQLLFVLKERNCWCTQSAK